VSTGFACNKTDAPASSGNNVFGGTSGAASSSSSSSGGRPSSDAGNAGTGDASSRPPSLVDVTNETLTVGGKERQYILAKPKNIDPTKSYPLVLSFHGNPGTAEGMANGLPFDSVSKSDAVIAYPAADGTNWDLYTPTDSNADMPFIQALVDEIKNNKANIDTSRVFGFGYSGGSFFITQMACRFEGLFKAIAVNAGGGPDEMAMGFEKRGDGCYVCPGGPIATLVTHGAADTEVETASGEFTAACFAEMNGCGDSRSAATPAPCETYDDCATDKPVKRCIIPDLGHGIWSEAMKEAWAFFKAVP
jgi:polyhydroxybutyrate depolymerase